MPRTRLSILALAIALPACGGGGGGGGGGGSGGGTPFTVVARKPVPDATDVPLTASFFVKLNRAPALPLNPSHVILSQGVSAVPRALSYDAFHRVITIDPLGTLTSSAVYTVTLSGLTDTNGVAVAPEAYTVTTTASADATLPTFSSALTPSMRTTSGMRISWSAASDDQPGTIHYEIFAEDGFDPTAAPIDVTDLFVDLSGLPSDTPIDIRVRARDAAGNVSALQTVIAKTLTSWSQDVYGDVITNNRCRTCHLVGGIAPFSMETQQLAYQNLVDVMFNAVVCAGMPAGSRRVVPGDVASSFLAMKINPSPPCGERMPFDGAANGYLMQPQIDTIEAWIAEGALDN